MNLNKELTLLKSMNTLNHRICANGLKRLQNDLKLPKQANSRLPVQQDCQNKF